MKKTIAVWMSPEAGHTLPALKVGADLKSRGHRVVYIVSGRIAKELDRLGFETTPFFSSTWPELAARSLFSPCPPGLAMYRDLTMRLGSNDNRRSAMREEIKRLADELQPDLFILDGVHGGDLQEPLQDVCGVVALYPQLWYPLKDIREMVALYPQLWYPLPQASDWFCPRIYLCPKEFELPELRQADVDYTGPALWPPNRDVNGTRLSSAGTLVYSSLGSQIRSYPNAQKTLRHIMEAATQMRDVSFVINTCGEASPLKDPPPNVKVARYLPHADVLPNASVAIVHGGLGIIKECIYHKVPMLVIPQKWDQPGNALRVSKNGIGLSISATQGDPAYPNVLDAGSYAQERRCELNGALVAEAIQTLLRDPGFAERISQMSTVFVCADRQQQAAEICEEILKT